VAEARPRISLLAQELARAIQAILVEHQLVLRRLAQAKAHPAAAADVARQLEELMPAGWIGATPAAQLAHLPRYLKALGLRIEKLRADPDRDARLLAEVVALETPWRRAVAQRRGQPDPRLEEFRWLLEELRVSLFAQELRTPMPVSIKRLQKAWQAIVATG
jgi:ATP-dependent helicase HrpA